MTQQEGRLSTEKKGEVASRQSPSRAQADINANMYALVPKPPEGEDLLSKTYESFQLQNERGLTQQEADDFQRAQKQRKETHYMATNPQLTMQNGKFDVESPEYQQFKRQNITKWGATNQVMMNVEKHLSAYNINIVYVDVQSLL